MQSIIDLYKNSKHLHHAYYVVEHKVDEFMEKLQNFFEEVVGMKTSGNPDFIRSKYKTLTIDHAREIAESQERKDFSSGKKIFVIEANFITEEAQNALLKVFEEPTEGTHFFIVSPQDMLLPTLRSRMLVIASESQYVSKMPFDISILAMKLEQRLAKVKEIVDSISDEESTKQDAISFLNQIESELYKKGTVESEKALDACALARASLYDRGAPIKMILENLVLSI